MRDPTAKNVNDFRCWLFFELCVAAVRSVTHCKQTESFVGGETFCFLLRPTSPFNRDVDAFRPGTQRGVGEGSSSRHLVCCILDHDRASSTSRLQCSRKRAQQLKKRKMWRTGGEEKCYLHQSWVLIKSGQERPEEDGSMTSKSSLAKTK